MATFEAQVEGITQIDITEDSAPSRSELNQHFKDAVSRTVNKITSVKPGEAMKFASTSELANSDGIDISGKILGIVRGNSSTTILKAASEVPAQIRYEVTDKTSLMYKSAHNPAFYVLNGKIHVLPVPTSDSRAYITQLSYDREIAVDTDDSISNFPDEYLDLIVLYASALTCQSAANDMHANLPDKPVAPTAPHFDVDDVDMPSLPAYTPPKINFNFSNIQTAISNEDFELAEKEMTVFDKRVEEYSKTIEQQDSYYQRELEIFKADLERAQKNTDRSNETSINEYRSEVAKFQYDISKYSQELQESLVKYKWYNEQYAILLNEYNENIKVMLQRKQTQDAQQQKPRKESKESRRR